MSKTSDTTYDREWVGRWLLKEMEARGIGPAALGPLCGVTSQRISQITKGKQAAGIDLLWRLAAVLSDNEEYAQLPDATIRGALERLIAVLGPGRIIYLTGLSSSDAQAMIDTDETNRARRERLRAIQTKETDPKKIR